MGVPFRRRDGIALIRGELRSFGIRQQGPIRRMLLRNAGRGVPFAKHGWLYCVVFLPRCRQRAESSKRVFPKTGSLLLRFSIDAVWVRFYGLGFRRFVFLAEDFVDDDARIFFAEPPDLSV